MEGEPDIHIQPLRIPGLRPVWALWERVPKEKACGVCLQSELLAAGAGDEESESPWLYIKFGDHLGFVKPPQKLKIFK